MNSTSRSKIKSPEHPRSPLRTAAAESENRTDGMVNSPSRSPANSEQMKSPLGLEAAAESNLELDNWSDCTMNSPARSPIRKAEHPQSPLRLTAEAESEYQSNHTTNSLFRIRDPEHPQSPLRLATVDSAPSPPHNRRENQGPAPAIPVASFSTWRGTAATAEKAGGGGGTKDKALGGFMKRERMAMAAHQAVVGLRVAAAVLCLISFSVMAAARHKGWAEDSYDKYSEYRYCITVNILGFLYAGFQAFVEGKHLFRPDVGNIFNFSMDQILAYLLISAASAATARTDEWVEYWGNDPFPGMARGSAAVSFLAFLVFAMSSLVSAYKLFGRRL
ncbi:hypothetical protein J5N97_027968 [Dioscorea zingiberensis]|uniref:CASP-like protein n=1 Tax=Dioscorea zingiberensis TaxID=325984 RepID=A0A9D5BYC7_9LILI|nr:hypothetical protein J5N97_027968 [Dioscorea zingiberensis]